MQPVGAAAYSEHRVDDVAGEPVRRGRVAGDGHLVAEVYHRRRRHPQLGKQRDHRAGVGGVPGVQQGRLRPGTTDESPHGV